VGGERDLLELGAEPPDLVEEGRVLVWKREADGVGQVDHVGAGRHRRRADARDERRVRAGGVLAGELDLVGLGAGVRHGPAGMLDDLLGRQPELLLHVDRARGEEDVQPRASRVLECGGSGVDVLAAGAAERGDGGPADGLGDGADAPEVSR